MTVIIGVDVGIDGALAFLDKDSGKVLAVFDIPTITVERSQKRRYVDTSTLRRKICEVVKNRKAVAVVEDVNARPGQGVVSMFRFGESKGIVLGMLAGLQIGYTQVQPQIWKKKFDLTGKDKKESLLKVRALFPDLEVQSDHQADAILLACYGREYCGAL